MKICFVAPQILCATGLWFITSAVTVDWEKEYQTIDGFGACDAWYSQKFMNCPTGPELLDALFDTTKGAGLSILRQRVSPDMSSGPNSIDWADKNIAGNAWMINEVQKRGVKTIWAAPWSPPGWMKSNNNDKRGGTLKPQYYDDYAAYLAEYVKRIADKTGYTYEILSSQNEPGFKQWESCVWTPETMADFIGNYLKPAMDERKLSSLIMTPEMTSWDNIPDYVDVIMDHPTAKDAVGVIGGHMYRGRKTRSYNDRYPLPVWQTEWSYNTSPEDWSIESGVTWAKNFHDNLTGAQVRAVHYWWLVEFRYDKKKQQAFGQADENTGDYYFTKRLWAVGNFSRFVRPGFVRIDVKKNRSPMFLSVRTKAAQTDGLLLWPLIGPTVPSSCL